MEFYTGDQLGRASASSSPGSLAPQTVKPSSDLISTRTRRRTETAAGIAPPDIGYGLGPAGALDHLPGVLPPRREFHSRGRPRPLRRPLLLPPRRSPRCQSRPTATAQSLWELLSYDLRPLLATHRLHLASWMPLATLLDCSSLIPSRVIHMPVGSDNSRRSRRVTPQGVTSSSAGRRP